ncbi:hypothetical protein J6590_010577 [Homalodisca vitripennis]|nr:hypothetical protein J6590_010577 [Homalodisca vitripennis]
MKVRPESPHTKFRKRHYICDVAIIISQQLQRQSYKGYSVTSIVFLALSENPEMKCLRRQNGSSVSE